VYVRIIDMKTKVTRATCSVAGLGTRFLPESKSIPKKIMTLVDSPLTQHAIEEARAAETKVSTCVPSRGKSAVEDCSDATPDLENALRKKDKLDMLESTNMDSGEIAHSRQNKARAGAGDSMVAVMGVAPERASDFGVLDTREGMGSALRLLIKGWIPASHCRL
jgi:UTP-glucose-1-phosphate uridylyltransferase